MSNIQVYKFCKCTGHKCKPWLSRHGDNSISGSSVDQKVQIPCLQRIHCIFGLALIFFFLFFSRFRVESFSKTMHEHESQLSSHNSWNFYARLYDAIHCLLFNSHISSHRYIGQCLAACNRIEGTKFQKHANKSTLEIRKSILLYSWSRTSIMVQGHHDIVGSLNSAFAWTIKNPVVPVWSNA